MDQLIGYCVVSGAALATKRPQHRAGFCKMMDQLDADFAETREFGWQSLRCDEEVVNAFIEYCEDVEAELALFAR